MPGPGQSKDVKDLDAIQQQIWNARLPLEITLSASESRLYDQSDPYVVRASQYCGHPRP